MECAVITTYRCNARCQMCNIWQHPTRRTEEFEPTILEKLPSGMKRLNITGGEPTLRDDLLDIVRILYGKTRRLEISTNGFFTERLVKVCQQFPGITIRVSVEGLPKLNHELRGLRDGFDHALRTILRLKALKMRDVGFSVVISDRNCGDLLDLYHLCAGLGVELGNATMHNSFYFHKSDNEIQSTTTVLVEMEHLIRALLTSRRANLRMRVKDWGRAYINLGLMHYVQGRSRPLPCGAATDTFFVSPWGELLACNGSAEPWVMGDLKTQSFHEIWHGRQAEEVRAKVAACDRNCWMTGTAVPAMRRAPWLPAAWILRNKIRLTLGCELDLG